MIVADLRVLLLRAVHSNVYLIDHNGYAFVRSHTCLLHAPYPVSPRYQPSIVTMRDVGCAERRLKPQARAGEATAVVDRSDAAVSPPELPRVVADNTGVDGGAAPLPQSRSDTGSYQSPARLPQHEPMAASEQTHQTKLPATINGVCRLLTTVRRRSTAQFGTISPDVLTIPQLCASTNTKVWSE